MYKIFKVLCGLSTAVLLVGCNSKTDRYGSDGTTWGTGSFDSNGKRIYFTATSERGTSITYTGGSSMDMMMTGGRLACVSCHGTDGRGGTHIMHMQTMKAPDVRWSVLEGYDLETFRGAIVKGEDPYGDKLNQDMPRWNINDTDLTDLMDYLKSLQ